MTANQTDKIVKDFREHGQEIQEVHKSALVKCRPLKDRYDQCFNGWYRNSFLQGKVGNGQCDDDFDEYRACLIEAVHEKGMSHLELFGPKPPK